MDKSNVPLFMAHSVQDAHTCTNCHLKAIGRDAHHFCNSCHTANNTK